MPHSPSAKKRLRQNLKARTRNRETRSRLSTLRRRFSEALAEGDLTQAEAALHTAQKAFDQAGAKHVIHKNTAGRKIARMCRKLKAAKAAKA